MTKCSHAQPVPWKTLSGIIVSAMKTSILTRPTGYSLLRFNIWKVDCSEHLNNKSSKKYRLNAAKRESHTRKTGVVEEPSLGRQNHKQITKLVIIPCSQDAQLNFNPSPKYNQIFKSSIHQC